jgi:hypothetical protein
MNLGEKLQECNFSTFLPKTIHCLEALLIC